MAKRKRDFSFEHGRLPPQAIELENAILAVMINFPQFIEEVKFLLRPEIFYKDHNQVLCRELLKLYAKNDSFDIANIINHLKREGQLEIIGGPYYITQLSSSMINPMNIRYNTMIVFQQYLKRRMINKFGEQAMECYNDIADPFDIMDNVESFLHEIDIFREIKSSSTVEQTVKRTFRDIFIRGEGNIKTFYSTGNRRFDNILKISPGNIFLIAGASGVGKTKFSTRLLRQLLLRHKDISVMWYCMEDPDDKIIRCFISQTVLLTDSQLLSKNYKLTQDDLHLIVQARNEFDDYDIDFVTKSDTIKNIKKNFITFCKKRKKKKNMNILVIDNIMKLADNRIIRNQNEADDHIAATIQSIEEDTRDYRSLIIPLHHFTKDTVARTNLKEAFRPTRDHLRGSGRYFDAATQVAFINKPGVFERLVSDMPSFKNELEYLFITEIAKNRNDKLGIVRWWADFGYNVFQEMEL